MIQSLLIKNDHLQFSSPLILPSSRTDYSFNHPLTSTSKATNCTQASSTVRQKIALTNICFEIEQNIQPKQSKAARIHGKLAIQKMSKNRILLFNKQKQSIKKNNSSLTLNDQIRHSQQQLLKSKNHIESSINLQSRTIELDQQLKNLYNRRKQYDLQKKYQHKRLNTEIFEEKRNVGNQELVVSVSELKNEKCFENLTQKIEKDEIPKQKQKGKNGYCFYAKLKSKIQSQLKKIQQKNSINKQNLLITGCQIKKCIKGEQINPRSLTDRPRPKTAITKTGLQLNTSQKISRTVRPKSCKSRTLQRKEIQYLSIKSNDLFNSRVEEKKKQKNSKKVKVNSSFEPSTHKTLNHIAMLYKEHNLNVTKSVKEKEKMKEKVLGLILQCQSQTEQHEKLEEGLKVFEGYTKVMNKGLSQAQQILQGAQNFPIQHEYTFC